MPQSIEQHSQKRWLYILAMDEEEPYAKFIKRSESNASYLVPQKLQ